MAGQPVRRDRLLDARGARAGGAARAAGAGGDRGARGRGGGRGRGGRARRGAGGAGDLGRLRRRRSRMAAAAARAVGDRARARPAAGRPQLARGRQRRTGRAPARDGGGRETACRGAWRSCRSRARWASRCWARPQARGLGVASFLAVGNRADVSTNDLLEYWEDDDAVAAIGLYVESFGNPRRFSQIARRVSRRKPILVVKGQLARPLRAAARRAGSHTAAALRSEDVFDALFHDAGVLRVDSTDELFDVADAVRAPAAACRAQRRRREQLGRAGDAGRRRRAVARAAVAAAEREPPSSGCAGALPHATHVANPVDLTVGAEPGDFATAVRELLRESAIDAVVVLFIALAEGDAELRARRRRASRGRLREAGRRRDPGRRRPAAASTRPGACRTSACPRRASPRWAAPPTAAPGSRARSASPLACPASSPSARASWWPRRSPAPATATAGWTPRRWRRCWTPTAFRSRRPRAAATPTRRSPPPRASAVRSRSRRACRRPSHAGDIDAVLLGLSGEDAIRAGWQELRRRVRAAALRRGRDEVVVQPLVDGGADILVGSVSDPDLGPLVGLGVGGRRPALAHAITFRLAPTTDAAGRGADRRLDRRRGLA